MWPQCETQEESTRELKEYQCYIVVRISLSSVTLLSDDYIRLTVSKLKAIKVQWSFKDKSREICITNSLAIKEAPLILKNDRGLNAHAKKVQKAARWAN